MLSPPIVEGDGGEAVKTKGLSIQRAVGLARLVLGLSLTTVRAEATTLVVNSTSDVNDGECNAAHCSLREAINAANASAGPGTIGFSILCPVPLTAILIQDASRRAKPGSQGYRAVTSFAAGDPAVNHLRFTRQATEG
jgi:CSLREA domain-containing protein